eukprot:COSAG01_NODE_1337_length_10667_cov_77.938115_6_plen_102_part_00
MVVLTPTHGCWGCTQPVLPNETAASRSIWSGWHEAGAKALAMRPNSLWGGSSSAPWVVGRALTEDVVFAGQHGLLATDFDSNVAQVFASRAASTAAADVMY